jgi:hypothetical protein
MFDIGSLVTISKGVLDSLKIVNDLFKSQKKNSNSSSETVVSNLKEQVDSFQSRLEGLAIQLQQSEKLTRMIPAWEATANNIHVVGDISSLSNEEALRIHVSLRNLIDASVRDTFSSTFFRSDFAALPGMGVQIEVFRSHIKNLDRTVSTIPAGNLEVFKSLWPSLSVEFNNVRNAGYEIRNKSEDLQARLIEELLESTREARKSLALM